MSVLKMFDNFWSVLSLSESMSGSNDSNGFESLFSLIFRLCRVRVFKKSTSDSLELYDSSWKVSVLLTMFVSTLNWLESDRECHILLDPVISLLSFFVLKNILYLLAKRDSGELRCRPKALIPFCIYKHVN